MEQGVLNAPEVLDQLGTVVIAAKINVDEQPEIAERFGISSYPFDVLVDPDGAVLLRSGGYAPAEDYLQRMQAARPRATSARLVTR